MSEKLKMPCLTCGVEAGVRCKPECHVPDEDTEGQPAPPSEPQSNTAEAAAESVPDSTQRVIDECLQRYGRQYAVDDAIMLSSIFSYRVGRMNMSDKLRAEIMDRDAQLNYERMENYKQDKQIGDLTAQLKAKEERLVEVPASEEATNNFFRPMERIAELEAARDKFKAALEKAEKIIKLAKSWCDAGAVESGDNPEASLSWAIECYYAAREALGQTFAESRKDTDHSCKSAE